MRGKGHPCGGKVNHAGECPVTPGGGYVYPGGRSVSAGDSSAYPGEGPVHAGEGVAAWGKTPASRGKAFCPMDQCSEAFGTVSFVASFDSQSITSFSYKKIQHSFFVAVNDTFAVCDLFR